ncbi:hypothetical protein T552_01440 [Pneumocystis carinii B80]|uniref:U3 small nucleolar RNA-associated protein 11 n=1 Tax=Pneumocystis carinii (strain B80) TaxID=1408658 RepID=A0A0W4ZKB0_PNEC8|nr:hypothetical protein T552_01440 [Pneumocystis carinii B80]KTW28810.1 hypothetical protein T552_01440 [Pneumocystis carinii B80]
MGTLKHSLQRRNHKERSQPVEREKWGLLEKPKDYRLRARDYQSKQRRLKRLREKAAEKNPDEFYFGMMKEKTKDGIVIVDRGNPVLTEETVRLLKTQDAGYIKMMLHIENKKVKKLEQYIYTDDKEATNCSAKHYCFVDETNLESQEKTYQKQKKKNYTSQIHEKLSEEPFSHDDSIETYSNLVNEDQTTQTSKVILSANPKLIRELASRRNRIEKLSMLERQIDLQRNLQTKGERKKMGTTSDGIPIYRWKLERKR